MNLFDPRTRNRIFWGLVAACALTVALDLVHHKHGYFAFEEWIGFAAVFGFFACVGLILLARVLRKLVGRSEDFYDR